jgi:DUF1365 family protein
VNKPQKIAIHMKNRRHESADKVEFDATLSLTRLEIKPFLLTRLLASYPLMTLKVALGIYWQALKLFVKKVPLHVHPKKQEARS